MELQKIGQERSKKERHRVAQREYRQSVRRRLEEIERLKRENEALRTRLHTCSRSTSQSRHDNSGYASSGEGSSGNVQVVFNSLESSESVEIVDRPYHHSHGPIEVYAPLEAQGDKSWDVTTARELPHDWYHLLESQCPPAPLQQGGLEATPEIADKTGYTAALFAAEGGHVELLDILIQHGANLFTTDCKSSTLLHKACQNGHSAVAELLLRVCGVTLLNMKDSNGFTPLHLAVQNKHVEIALLLLASGADVNACL